MTKRAIFFICLLFLLVLVGLRIGWVHLWDAPPSANIEQGVLDLRDTGLPEGDYLSLGGEWEFYPNQILIDRKKPTELMAAETKAHYIQMPGDWKDYLDELEHPDFFYGSYRLRILLPDSDERPYTIRVTSIPSATELFVDGKSIRRAGKPTDQIDTFEFQTYSYSATFVNSSSEIEIVLQFAAVDLSLTDGIITPLLFGSPKAITKHVWFNVGAQFTVCIVLLIHMVYAAVLYGLGIRQPSVLYFFLFLLSAALSLLVSVDRLLFSIILMDYEWIRTLQSLSYLFLSIFLYQFVKQLLPEYTNTRRLHYLSYAYYAYILFILISPGHWMVYTIYTTMLIAFIPYLIITNVAIRAILKGNKNAIFLLLGIIAGASSIFWGVFEDRMIVESIYYPIDTIITMLTFAAFWFKHYIQTSTEVRELSVKLQAADKRKDDFLTNTSHELRNPLHGILNITQSVLEQAGGKLDKTNKQNLELLAAIGRRMAFMLNDLIDLTRLKENDIRLSTQPLQLTAAANNTMDMLRFLSRNKPITFHNDIADDFPQVMADENRLIQILFNLLHNAVKYTNEGRITVSAQIHDTMAVVAVADTGIGIVEEKLQFIFKPYEQIDGMSTNAGGGIGLGLSICKQLVELHGGRLEVQSRLGEGSIFRFSLPLASTEASAVQEYRDWVVQSPALIKGGANHGFDNVQTLVEEQIVPPSVIDKNLYAPQGAEQPVRVLVVDDDPVNLMVLTNILSAERYEVTMASSGKDALKLLQVNVFDLIISENLMTNMSGQELTRQVRCQFSLSELPILLLTAQNRSKDIESGFQAGANDYMIKPVDTTELKIRVQALTDLKKAVRSQLLLEAAWLQAQIQPHFLFNTLHAISALSLVDVEQMQQLLDRFSTYLRTSFDFRNLEQLVPLDQELELVDSYLYIEKARFEDRLNVIWEIDTNRPVLIPPLSIQPLVENAVRHGVLKRANGGDIRIRIRVQEDQAVVSVIDNGIGMDEEQVKRLFTKTSVGGSGVGLYNTDRRLKQLYGTGLSVTSKPNQGTAISFTLTTNYTS
jgi:two-component system sensor histidine kinase ChiS